MTTTWLITFLHSPCSPDEAEAAGAELIERGALGVEHTDPTRLSAFFEGSQSEAMEFGKASCTHPLQNFSIAKIEETNWVQACNEVLEEVSAGPITIKPINCREDLPLERGHANTIYLIPGMGFGTGHHVTTRSALTLLSHSFVKETNPGRALDVGTGSGILALGAVSLYGCSVDAFDTDSMAVDNAVENIEINGFTDKIKVSTGSIDSYFLTYDLIMANIYAEVLSQLEKSIRHRVTPGKPLIVSGIMQARLSLIEGSYLPDTWKLIDAIEENGWVSRLYERL